MIRQMTFLPKIYIALNDFYTKIGDEFNSEKVKLYKLLNNYDKLIFIIYDD